MAEQEKRMEALEKKGTGGAPSVSSNASGYSYNSDEVTYIEVKGFYDWDTGVGEVEDVVIFTWMEKLFSSTEARGFFDERACHGNAHQRINHRSFRLYFDSGKVKSKNVAHRRLSLVKRFLSNNQLNTREAFATLFDPVRRPGIKKQARR